MKNYITKAYRTKPQKHRSHKAPKHWVPLGLWFLTSYEYTSPCWKGTDWNNKDL